MIAINKKTILGEKTPMPVRITRAIEETYARVRDDLLICLGGSCTGRDMRASVADFIDTHDDREAAKAFRALPPLERDAYLRAAMPASRYTR